MSDSGIFWAAFAGGASAGTVGLFGVIVSEWRRWWLDRPLLVVGANLGFIYHRGAPRSEQLVFLQARNPHSKPVTVVQCGFVFKKRAEGMLWISPVAEYPFPHEVAGGKSVQSWIPTSRHLEHLKGMNKTPADLKWVFFTSADGKTFERRIDKTTLQALQEKSEETE